MNCFFGLEPGVEFRAASVLRTGPEPPAAAAATAAAAASFIAAGGKLSRAAVAAATTGWKPFRVHPGYACIPCSEGAILWCA